MQKKILFIVLTVIVAGGILVGLMGSNNTSTVDDQNASQEVSKQAENEVVIQNFAFNPDKLVVKKGTTVTWTNADTARHNIDFADSDMQDSELLAQGESFSYTFDEVGQFNYICTPHPYMEAIVEVIE